MKFELEPLKIDKKGKEFSDYKTEEFYKKIFEGVLTAHTQAIYSDTDKICLEEYTQNEAEALLNVMTICATRLTNIRHDCEDSLDYLQKKLIEDNRDKGYLEEE